ncbi:hypothetical protein D3C86_2158330 [compost metagenome]
MCALMAAADGVKPAGLAAALVAAGLALAAGAARAGWTVSSRATPASAARRENGIKAGS